MKRCLRHTASAVEELLPHLPMGYKRMLFSKCLFTKGCCSSIDSTSLYTRSTGAQLRLAHASVGSTASYISFTARSAVLPLVRGAARVTVNGSPCRLCWGFGGSRRGTSVVASKRVLTGCQPAFAELPTHDSLSSFRVQGPGLRPPGAKLLRSIVVTINRAIHNLFMYIFAPESMQVYRPLVVMLHAYISIVSAGIRRS